MAHLFVRTSPSGPIVDIDTDSVLSIFTRLGAIVPVAGDYATSLLTNTSTVTGATVSAALETLAALKGFDFIISKKADFPAPSGGIITLTSGSYAIKNPIDLGTDKIVVPTGVEVLIMGMGPEKIITTDLSSASTIEFEAGCTGTLAHLSLENTASSLGWAFENESDGATLLNCQLIGGQQGIRVIGGDLTAIACLCNGNTHGVEVRGGDLYLSQHRALDNDVAMHISAATTSVFWVGGWILNLTDGLRIDANVDVLHLEGIACNSGGDFVDYNSGTIARASIVGCRATTTDAIDWAAAGMPTLGLTLGHNVWDCSGTTYNGFTEASARVNIKGDIDSGGLVTETVIVP